MPFQPPPVLSQDKKVETIIQALKQGGFLTQTTAQGSSEEGERAMTDAFKVMQLIRGYMAYGHTKADLDPLQLTKVYPNFNVGRKYSSPSVLRTLLDYRSYGLSEADLDK
jgi:2-oxoglutarate dehydrogenase complex dehydrogenase (E1) component-like enzyme